MLEWMSKVFIITLITLHRVSGQECRCRKQKDSQRTLKWMKPPPRCAGDKCHTLSGHASKRVRGMRPRQYSSYAWQFLLGTLFSGSGVVRWIARIVPPVKANRVSPHQAMQFHGLGVPPTCCRTSSRLGEYQQFRVLRGVKASTALLYRLRHYHRNIGLSRPRGILVLSAFLQTRSVESCYNL